MEVACEPLSEEKGQLLLDIVDAGVNSRGWYGEQEQVEDPLEKLWEALIDDGFDDLTIHIS